MYCSAAIFACRAACELDILTLLDEDEMRL